MNNMKLNYADRRNDTNILNKTFVIYDSNDNDFEGKISLIDIKKINKNFEAVRPNGTKDLIIADNYKIMTYFPKHKSYCMTVMYDDAWNLKQWYFDIEKSCSKYDNGIPYSEDLYLDLIVLPDGTFYSLDENELKDALLNNLISEKEFDSAYETMGEIVKMVKDDFSKLSKFTKKSVECLKKL